jgi:hypothetical protein
MESAFKTKLTLWVPGTVKAFGKVWAREHGESLSELFSDYLLRLKQTEEKPSKVSPVVSRLTGVLKDKKAGVESYHKHLEKKYLNG